jgi:precorrin-6Y C5,15-methyltransferase (decarboxylating)
MKAVSIIGMGTGPEDLTARHLRIIEQADILLGGRRLLEYFSDMPAYKKMIGKDIAGIIQFIRKKIKDREIVVLASGDPLFFGIGARLAASLGNRQVRIYPNISAVAAAFARIKESWDDARIISLHGRKKSDTLFSALEHENKVVVFTDPKKNPSWLAERLLEMELSHFKMCVFEAMGSNAERFGWYPLKKAAGVKFRVPNLVVLKRRRLEPHAGHGIHLGASDNCYCHTNGLITKAEIRAITLSKMRLASNHILWDLGSGSGSISIEASLFIKTGTIFAVEKDPGRIENIKKNKRRFKTRNLRIVQTVLPGGLAGLPQPDRIFIGGGGKNLKAIVTEAAQYLKPGGKIVINTVLIQNFQVVMAVLSRLKFETDVIQVQINRSRQMPWGERLEAQNPVWIISGFHKDM